VNFELLVDGQRHGGWTRASVSLGIEQMAAAFSLDYTQRGTADAAARPIRPGQRCVLELLGQPVLTGWIDEDSASLDKSTVSYAVNGRSLTADLIDCSAIHRSGQWAGRTLSQIASDLVKPFGIPLRVRTSVGAPLPSFALQEGETVFEALDRAARLRGLLLAADGDGALVIIRAGSEQAPGELREGQNIESVQVTRNLRDRFSRIVVKGQSRGDDLDNGATVSSPSAVATDAGVKRHRPLIVLAEEQGVSLAARASWEQRVRVARGLSAAVTVSGFEAAPGKLWRVNTLVRCVAPSVGLDSELLIAALEYRLDDGGSATTLTLVPPDAFAETANVAQSRLGRKLATKALAKKPKKADSIQELQQ
jgi:prophage tail gpP-like protein